MKPYKVLLICLSIILLLSFFPVQSSSANSVPTIVFEVNSTEDLPDALPNGICSANSNTNGPCTLRAAVNEASDAIAAGRGNVHIKIPAGHYILTRTSDISGLDERFGDLDFLSLDEPTELEVLIEGIGNEPSIIDANGIDRVFEIQAYHNITITNLIIQNGEILDKSTEPGGAGLLVNSSTLTLKHSRVLNNKIVYPTSWRFMNGGGILSNNSTLYLLNTEFAHNHATNGAAIQFDVYHPNVHSLIIDQSSFHHNSGDEKLIEVDSRAKGFFILNSTFSDNSNYLLTLLIRSETWIQNTTIISPGLTTMFIDAPVHIRNSIIINLPRNANGLTNNCHHTKPEYVISEG